MCKRTKLRWYPIIYRNSEYYHGILLYSDGPGVYLGKDPRFGSGEFSNPKKKKVKNPSVKKHRTGRSKSFITFSGRFQSDFEEVEQKQKEQRNSDVAFVPTVSFCATSRLKHFCSATRPNQKNRSVKYHHTLCDLPTVKILRMFDKK